MRVGIFGISSIVLLFCFIIINSSSISPEKIDAMFEGVDYNAFSDPDLNFSDDVNLSKGIKLIGSGMIKEFHGTYYIASWFNTLLPPWIFEHKEYFVYGAIIVFCAPLIAVVLEYGVLLFLALCLVVWGRVKVWRDRKKKIKRNKDLIDNLMEVS